MVAFSHDFALQVANALQRLPPALHYCIAYSGGVDSHVLLHIMARLANSHALAPIQALHVHHGLSQYADQWLKHCEAVCVELNLPFKAVYVDATPPVGVSPEDYARKLRYQAFAQEIKPHTGLLLAQHQDDQAETLLLQLCRGAGALGLASMATWQPFATGFMARPLLACTRLELETYATTHNLRWVEDDSNMDLRFDRNFLRADILPRLQHRFPGIRKTLARAATHQADAEDLMAELARRDLQVVRALTPGALSVRQLNLLRPALQRNLLRYWLLEKGLPMPSQAKLQSIIHDVLRARYDRTPMVSWEGAELRRYRDELHAMPPLPKHDATRVWQWDTHTPLVIEHLGLRLSFVALLPCCLCLRADESLTVRFRQGGETMRINGKRRAVKKLLQEAGIPPWERDRIPLLYRQDELICIVQRSMCMHTH